MIVIVFTGGTISMRHDPHAGGAVPSLRGHDLMALVPGIDRIATIEVDDWGAHPGPHMNTDRMWALRNRVRDHVARPDVQGVVVTHGTDSLEETAYLIARSVETVKPIVLTGAMRTSTDLGWDGPANLAGAVRTAASKEARGAGVLVVMSDRIFAALDVTKVHTSMVDAFDSPGLGPLGVLDDTSVVFRRALPTHVPVLDPKDPAHPVDIVYAWSGADSRLLDASRADGKGLIVAGMGRGNVPPAMVEGIERWLRDEKPVVMTSRVVRGRVGRTYAYAGGARPLADKGVILGDGLRPQQARIDLMLGLGAGMSVSELRMMFEGR